MAPPKKFATEADRQADYRQRKQAQQDLILRAVATIGNPRAEVRERLEAALLIWRMTRQQAPENAPEGAWMLVNQLDAVLTGFSVDPQVTVPKEWNETFTAMLAGAHAWLLQYQAARAEARLFETQEVLLQERSAHHPLSPSRLSLSRPAVTAIAALERRTGLGSFAYSHQGRKSLA